MRTAVSLKSGSYGQTVWVYPATNEYREWLGYFHWENLNDDLMARYFNAHELYFGNPSVVKEQDLPDFGPDHGFKV